MWVPRISYTRAHAEVDDVIERFFYDVNIIEKKEDNITATSKTKEEPVVVSNQSDEKNSMNKAFITNCAVNISKSENLLLLDDDNYFISNHTIETIINLLKKYNLIFGNY